MSRILLSAPKQTHADQNPLKLLTWFFLAICFSFTTFQATAGTYVTSGAINPNTNRLYPWNNAKAWRVVGLAGVPTRLPNSSDDIILSDSISITNNPAGLQVYCKSLILDNTVDRIALTINSGATLNVDGDVHIKSPDTGVNTIHMPQGNLLINGSLLLGELQNNSKQGTASIYVAGPTGSGGVLKVKGNISNIGKFNSAYRVDVLGYGKLELGGSLTSSNLLTIDFSASSIIKFDGTKAQFIPSNVTFGNMQVANPAGAFLTGPVTTTNLLGNLEVLTGKLENSGHPISGRVAKNLLVEDGARLVLSGFTTFPSGFTPILKPTSTVAYDGTADQNVGVQNYGNLELSGSTTTTKYRKFLMGNTTARNTSVAADLMLDNGSLNIGNYTLTLKPDGAIRNYNTSNYIILDTGGKMLAESVGPAASGLSTEVAFPIGTSTTFSPAFITNSGTINNFSVGVVNGMINYANSQPITTHVVKKTWDIECVNLNGAPFQNGTPNVSLRLKWETADEATVGFDNQNCYVTHYTGGMWSKSDVYQNATLNGMSAVLHNVTSFSPFGVSSGAGPLPVEMVSFKAVKNESNVLLTWETATEKNCLGYDILASTNGVNFEVVGYVASKNSNANFNQRYEFLDKTNRTGLVYYRLKQTDLDGTVAYYAAKVIDMGRPNESLTAYPNPFQDAFRLKLETASPQEVQLLVTDLTGKTVYQEAVKVIAGHNEIPVKLNAALPAGMYILTANTTSQKYTARLIKQ